ncbi:hypothetical protein MB46_02680 [Arthrobacter alpinus]|uniref:LPXTG cell wall anchor domain-containing protein n=1 Tax=Arthrobacter alpinus TaxID=656366 RepID=UPI0006794F95|nr:LPXTG cell wall anchor domain-containing protein [Arthrobacter alpinus]ALV44586.1 hypothetical protein MB46_02680 [Arthrobacter alpinus]
MGKPPSAGDKGLRLLAGVILAVAASTAVGVHGATAASAEVLVPVPETGASGMLALSSSVYPLTFPALNPGDAFSFQIGVGLSGANKGTASLQISATGNLAQTGGYTMQIQECASLWDGTSGINQGLVCESGATNVIPAQPIAEVDQAIKLPLSDVTAKPSKYLLVMLQRPATATALPLNPTLNLGIGVYGFGDDPSAVNDEPLPTTGSRIQPFLWAGGVLLAAGAGVVVAHKRKGRTS